MRLSITTKQLTVHHMSILTDRRGNLDDTELKPPISIALRDFFSFFQFFRLGLQTVFFQKIDAGAWTIRPSQLMAMVILTVLASIGQQRLMITGPANFYASSLMWGWLLTAVAIWLCWLITTHAAREGRHVQTAALFAVWIGQTFIFEVLSTLSYIAIIEPNGLDGSITHWTIYGVLTTWSVLAYWLLLTHSGHVKGRLIVITGAFVIIFPVINHHFQQPWLWYPQEKTSEANNTKHFELTQESIEKQFQVAALQRAGLQPQRPGVTDLYSISFAPYAHEAVFLHESLMLNKLMEERFDAAGHTQELINHVSTQLTKPWATPENLQRAINQAAERMNMDEDILFIYLTSHGGKDFKLSASHWPLTVDELTPQRLNSWLDKAGVKYRVIAISACYSGGWIDVLQNGNSLIMTAADKDHTSYGCGRKSDMTYFGRAVFDEQLRHTYSFEQAFKAAVPLIKQREEVAKKTDGFSNPQIYMGKEIRPILQKLEQHLAQTDHPT